jgi:hypothetical protein
VWRRALGWHGTDSPSCWRRAIVPAQHEKRVSCSCCALSATHSAGTTRHEMASCRSCPCRFVPVPAWARAVLCWAAQMAIYRCSSPALGAMGRSNREEWWHRADRQLRRGMVAWASTVSSPALPVGSAGAWAPWLSSLLK